MACGSGLFLGRRVEENFLGDDGVATFAFEPPMEFGFGVATPVDVFDFEGRECPGFKREFELQHLVSFGENWIGLLECDADFIVKIDLKFVGAGCKGFDKSGPGGGELIRVDTFRRFVSPVEVHDWIDSRENRVPFPIWVIEEFCNQS